MASLDKQQILRPDYITPFNSFEDVFHRLQPFYRILEFKESQDEGIYGNHFLVTIIVPTVDASLLGRIEKLKEQFSQNILGKSSDNTDKITLEKLFLIEEKVRLDAVKATCK
jgi:hypothetical protein